MPCDSSKLLVISDESLFVFVFRFVWFSRLPEYTFIILKQTKSFSACDSFSVTKDIKSVTRDVFSQHRGVLCSARRREEDHLGPSGSASRALREVARRGPASDGRVVLATCFLSSYFQGCPFSPEEDKLLRQRRISVG